MRSVYLLFAIGLLMASTTNCLISYNFHRPINWQKTFLSLAKFNPTQVKAFNVKRGMLRAPVFYAGYPIYPFHSRAYHERKQ
uniref:Uncharacterized protein n=1 Tax=Plectus sambesii TaxID=2011161 RepID=A0A914VU34_9BILA